jgi:hypothetical protein
MTLATDPVVARWRQLLSGSQLSGGQGHQSKERRRKKRERLLARKNINITDYQQLAIPGTGMHHSTEYWGDKMEEKREGVCRVGLLNPSGFTLSGGSAKDDQLRELMKAMQVDIMCFPEVNVCWHKLAPSNQLEECTAGWFETMH